MSESLQGRCQLQDGQAVQEMRRLQGSHGSLRGARDALADCKVRTEMRRLQGSHGRCARCKMRTTRKACLHTDVRAERAQICVFERPTTRSDLGEGEAHNCAPRSISRRGFQGFLCPTPPRIPRPDVRQLPRLHTHGSACVRACVRACVKVCACMRAHEMSRARIERLSRATRLLISCALFGLKRDA